MRPRLNHLEKNINLDSVNDKLINIILTKAFKGSPLFIIDIVKNLINSMRFIYFKGKEATITPELLDMETNNDWSEFTIPLRIEKMIGSIVDSLDIRDIILLKHASIIGNLFDLDKLNRLNIFDNVSFDEMYAMIQNLEVTFY